MVTKHISQEDYDLLQKVKQQKFKDLTDEEIDSFSNLLKVVYRPVANEVTLSGVRDFARAILRKAQE